MTAGPLLRAICGVITALMLLLGLSLESAAAEPLRTCDSLSAYSYDAQCATVSADGTHPESSALSTGPGLRPGMGEFLAVNAYEDSVAVSPVMRTRVHAQEPLRRDGEDLSTRMLSGVAAKSAPEVSQILMRSPGQLQSKFKHAGDLGLPPVLLTLGVCSGQAACAAA